MKFVTSTFPDGRGFLRTAKPPMGSVGWQSLVSEGRGTLVSRQRGRETGRGWFLLLKVE